MIRGSRTYLPFLGDGRAVAKSSAWLQEWNQCSHWHSRCCQMKSFNWTNPYPSIRIPVFARNVVSTSHPLAAQAGLQMLLKGGNAIDAAIAGAAAITIVEPVSCGLGGDAFAIVWDGKIGRAHV